MEEVEITMTLEIMGANNPATGPWKETALVAEIQVDPTVVSVTLHIQIWHSSKLHFLHVWHMSSQILQEAIVLEAVEVATAHGVTNHLIFW